MKVVGAATLAAVVMFFWSALSHMALPMGEAGLLSVPPDKEAVLGQAMQSAMTERSLYMYPSFDMNDNSNEAMAAHSAKVASGPSALIVYMPRGGTEFGAKPLLIEFGWTVVACLFAAWVLVHVPASVGYMKRVLLVAAFGAYATFDIDASYWNWYSFPTPYFTAQIVDHVVAAFLGGLVIAKIVK